MSDSTTRKTKRVRELCGNCDGEGHEYYCDDYLEGQCVTGWEMPCEDCEGKGWIWQDRDMPDPKWARMWKQMNPKAPS